MTHKTINSFNDLHEMVQSYRFGHYVFRGESSIGYTLRPKFGRSVASTQDNSSSIERSVFDAFLRRGTPYTTPLPANAWEWMAVAQHYGLATRLLDWTENPLVATYFAVGSFPPNDCVLYALDKSVIPDANTSESPFDFDGVVMYEPAHVSTRIAAQAGLFTAHSSPGEVFEHTGLDRWVIAGDAVIDIAIAVDGYGFNRATLFPGLEGIAFHINDWHLRGDREDEA